MIRLALLLAIVAACSSGSAPVGLPPPPDPGPPPPNPEPQTLAACVEDGAAAFHDVLRDARALVGAARDPANLPPFVEEFEELPAAVPSFRFRLVRDGRTLTGTIGIDAVTDFFFVDWALDGAVSGDGMLNWQSLGGDDDRADVDGLAAFLRPDGCALDFEAPDDVAATFNGAAPAATLGAGASGLAGVVHARATRDGAELSGRIEFVRGFPTATVVDVEEDGAPGADFAIGVPPLGPPPHPLVACAKFQAASATRLLARLPDLFAGAFPAEGPFALGFRYTVPLGDGTDAIVHLLGGVPAADLQPGDSGDLGVELPDGNGALAFRLVDGAVVVDNGALTLETADCKTTLDVSESDPLEVADGDVRGTFLTTATDAQSAAGALLRYLDGAVARLEAILVNGVLQPEVLLPIG